MENRGWKEVKLEELIKFGNGKQRPDAEGLIPVYGGNGILSYTNSSNYDGETLIIGRVGAYCGAVYYDNRPIWISDNALSGKPKDNYDTKFLYYFLKNLDLNQFAGGSSHPLVTQTLLNSLEFKVCINHNEQKAIASVLSSLDDKIDLLHQQNQTLEALAETLFRQWFVEEAKEDWEESDIYEFIDVVYGFPFKSKFFNEEQKGYPLVRIRNLKDGYSNVFTEEGCEEKHFLNNGDLVAGMDGEFRLYIWKGVKSVLNQRACKFVPKNDTIPPFYVYSLIKPHLEYYEYVKVGTTVIHLGKSDIDEIRIKIPTKDLLKKYGEITNPLFEKYKNNSDSIRTLTSLRDTLLPKLMSGEVRVKM